MNKAIGYIFRSFNTFVFYSQTKDKVTFFKSCIIGRRKRVLMTPLILGLNQLIRGLYPAINRRILELTQIDFEIKKEKCI